jgi:hypothetical protein
MHLNTVLSFRILSQYLNIKIYKSVPVSTVHVDVQGQT